MKKINGPILFNIHTAMLFFLFIFKINIKIYILYINIYPLIYQTCGLFYPVCLNKKNVIDALLFHIVRFDRVSGIITWSDSNCPFSLSHDVRSHFFIAICSVCSISCLVFDFYYIFICLFFFVIFFCTSTSCSVWKIGTWMVFCLCLVSRQRSLELIIIYLYVSLVPR